MIRTYKTSELMNDWHTVPLSALAEVFDGPHATPKKTKVGPVFLGISNLSQGRLDLTDIEYLSENDFTRWTRRVEPSKEDVVFSYETRIGEAALIPEGLKCCLGRRMGLLRVERGKVDPRFLLYAWIGPSFQETLRSRTVHGSTVDRLPISELGNFPINIPRSIAEQRAIAHVLGSLDDKIENNRRMNETLEAMARAIFKSWFVDFDPVRAKMEGHQPVGMDSETAALFPDSFEDSAMGSIPKGWKIGNIPEIADLISGGTPKTSEPSYWDGDIAWASAKDVSQCGAAFLIRTERSITKSGLENSATRIVPRFSTVVVSRGATTGRNTMFGDDLAMNQTCYGIRSKSGNHFFLNRCFETAVDGLVFAGHGSVFNTITTETFKRGLIVIPQDSLQTTYDELVHQMFHRILTNFYEDEHLIAIRDALLPKLLSGEIRVKEAEQVVEVTQ
jgi:type I restriction enzyme S subunit